MYNKLLERQIKRNLKNLPEIPPEFKAIFQAISDSYQHYEADRSLLERSLEVSSGELNLANGKVREQLKIIEEKNRDITDSIQYARRIQHAILPPRDTISKHFPESFIIYKPKDIVSGDFYWMTEKNGKILFAVCDCTGHGVPGALMSMIGSALLNQVVNEKGITNTSEILAEARNGIIKALKQKGESGEQKDGMDIALVAIDPSGSYAEFSGANNSLFYFPVSDDMADKAFYEIAEPLADVPGGYEIKADKQPIGIYGDVMNPFTSYRFPVKKGDMFYVFSDGYVDQFGGPKGGKFMKRKFKNLLVSIHRKSMPEQKQILENTFEAWKGTLEQVDDICVIGVTV